MIQPQHQQRLSRSHTSSPTTVTMAANLSRANSLTTSQSVPKQVTSSIPIHGGGGMHKTPSEVQLCQDLAVADYKDYVFYSRIVKGIRHKVHDNVHSLQGRRQNEQCLTHIMQTRHASQQPQADYDLGMPLDEPSTTYPEHYIRSVTAQALELVHSEEEEEEYEGVFDMDL